MISDDEQGVSLLSFSKCKNDWNGQSVQRDTQASPVFTETSWFFSPGRQFLWFSVFIVEGRSQISCSITQEPCACFWFLKFTIEDLFWQSFAVLYDTRWQINKRKPVPFLSWFENRRSINTVPWKRQKTWMFLLKKKKRKNNFLIKYAK